MFQWLQRLFSGPGRAAHRCRSAGAATASAARAGSTAAPPRRAGTPAACRRPAAPAAPPDAARTAAAPRRPLRPAGPRQRASKRTGCSTRAGEARPSNQRAGSAGAGRAGRHPVLAAVGRGAGAAHAGPDARSCCKACAATTFPAARCRAPSPRDVVLVAAVIRLANSSLPAPAPDHQRRTRRDPDRPGRLAPADHHGRLPPHHRHPLGPLRAPPGAAPVGALRALSRWPRASWRPALGIDPFDAFLAGLLQNVGLIVALRVMDQIAKDDRTLGSELFWPSWCARPAACPAQHRARMEFPGQRGAGARRTGRHAKGRRRCRRWAAC